MKASAPKNQLFILTHRTRYINMEMSFIGEVLDTLTESKTYELTKADWYEVHKELDELKKHLKVETVIPEVTESETG